MLEAVGAERLYVYAMGLEPWLEFLLGLAYTPDATQIKEAQRFLHLAREAGFLEARLLTGKHDIHLDHRLTPKALANFNLWLERSDEISQRSRRSQSST